MIFLLLRYLAQTHKLFLVSGFIFLSTYLIAVFFEESFIKFTLEDGIIENTGAIFFLIASALHFFAFVKANRESRTIPVKPKRKSSWLLLLSTLFFIAFGEEISWGQRLFNLKTPESIQELNVQGELNLHNLEVMHGRDWDGELKQGVLSWFNSHRMFYSLLLLYLLVMSLFVLISNLSFKVVRYLGIPVPPLWTGITLLLAILLVKIIQALFANQNQALYHSLVEIMETNIALVSALLGYSFLRKPSGYNLRIGL